MTESPKKRAKSTKYLPVPTLPRELVPRYEAILAALTGSSTISAAARRLDTPRNHFQYLLHRTQAAMIEALSPHPPGRPRATPKERELTVEVQRLRQQSEALTRRSRQSEVLLAAASELYRNQVSRTPAAPRRVRRRSRRMKTSPGSPDSGHQVEEGPAALLHLTGALTDAGAPRQRAARAVGASPRTLRRWRAAARVGRPLVARRGPRRRPPLEARAPALAVRVGQRVRETRGLIGADALRHAVPGVSRRDAAAVKRRTLTSMERERRAAATRVVVAQPGVLRAFDAMHFATTEGRRYALCAADGSVPFTTSAFLVRRYDTASVLAALTADFAEHGAPLVLRLDRASCHLTEPITALCRSVGVAVLHGPPRYAPFYGQLERANRDRRAFLRAVPCPTPAALVSELAASRVALNSLWPRRTLRGCSPEEEWRRRPRILVDRRAFLAEIRQRAARLAQNVEPSLAQRLAIQQALINRGLLRLQPGGGC